MNTIELWPTEIDGGDAISDDFSVPYLRAVDPVSGQTVILYFTPDAAAKFLAKFETMRARLIGANIKRN